MFIFPLPRSKQIKIKRILSQTCRVRDRGPPMHQPIQATPLPQAATEISFMLLIIRTVYQASSLFAVVYFGIYLN